MAAGLMVQFLHSTQAEIWSDVAACAQAMARDCKAGAITSSAALVLRLQRARRQPDQLRSLAFAIRQAESGGIAAEREICGPVFAFIAKLVVDLPEILADGIPMLVQNCSALVRLTRRQCAALLAASIFDALPHQKQQSADGQLELPAFDLTFVLNREQTKSMCILCYFVQLAKAPLSFLDEVVSFGRRSAELKTHEFWLQNTFELCPAFVEEAGCIEDSEGNLQADFANAYLGGGALSGGNVQEEIRFAVCPECYVGMLFFERMLPNEVIVIVGAQQYSRYTGYGGSFEFAEPRNVLSERPGQLDSHGRWGPHIVALDALLRPGNSQYQPDQLLRELNKAYIACLGDLEDGSPGFGFATGNWGCGMFGGDPQLKSLIQWLAASAASRSQLVYFPFGDTRVQELGDVVEAVKVKCKTCSDLYGLLYRSTPGAVFEGILNGA